MRGANNDFFGVSISVIVIMIVVVVIIIVLLVSILQVVRSMEFFTVGAREESTQGARTMLDRAHDWRRLEERK